MTTSTAARAPQPDQVDLSALKTKQHGAWSSGDYAVVGTTLQIVGENLCEALDLRSGSRVLDVAAGNGNATLAAARRWCEVVSTDYVPSLLESGQLRAMAEGNTQVPFSSRASTPSILFCSASLSTNTVTWLSTLPPSLMAVAIIT